MLFLIFTHTFCKRAEKINAKHVPVNLAAIARNQFDDMESESEPLKSDAAKCPKFVSLTASGKDPELMVAKNLCRFRIGK
ncbi:MAG: hypothetical protein D8M57_19405 [Candidatus Scalindua sp. AMX11]|nr:MAG: hypothetical protein D8M57_19405 [Candidatus Scalindua sp. AMX11]